ncbi:LLM class flavin-dependent oxidoreductase [Streptomyces sp. NRRL F-2580]|uniref:LLM class flavin-dependent oxidoreductase n=1 Tax=Streptomyces sp. NRRL F-2580 TaxID=1463841 RepID=UPI00099C2C93|nr:LLM class flavin-dependent oxidoreductase [Streptomyces sp. NRRL F-2580]
MTNLRLSVLDQTPVGEGHTLDHALRASVDLARVAEDLGYTRYWAAEHHGPPGFASSAPEILAGALLAHTSRMRIGTGDVLLPRYEPAKEPSSGRHRPPGGRCAGGARGERGQCRPRRGTGPEPAAVARPPAWTSARTPRCRRTRPRAATGGRAPSWSGPRCTALVSGAPEQVHSVLTALAGTHGVDELVVNTLTSDPADRQRSYELPAEAFALPAALPSTLPAARPEAAVGASPS